MKKQFKKFNKDYDWNYDPTTYITDNYATLILEDHRLNYITICALRSRIPGIARPLKHALHIGIGGVPRGSAFISPFIDEDGIITMGDIGIHKLRSTQRLMQEMRSGNLGIWQTHEDHMATIDPRWKGSFKKAAQLSQVVELDLEDLQEDTYDIAVAEHVFESATKDHSEYKKYVRQYLRSVRPGGIVHLAYIVGSEGYTAGGIEYPAYPITPDELVVYAQEELVDIENYFTTASGQMRETGDTHKYAGMGVLIGIRRT